MPCSPSLCCHHNKYQRADLPTSGLNGEKLLRRMSSFMALRTRHGRRPRRLLTKSTSAAGVTQPIIDS
jgi:hypothetical protein